MGSEWETMPLSNVVKLVGGFAFKSQDFISEGIPVIKIKNVRHRDIDLTDVDYVSKETSIKCWKFLIKHGDILISMTGSGIQAPASIVGRVARHSGVDESFLINQRVGRFEVLKPDCLCLRFLYYYFSQRETQLELVSIATGSANQVNLSASQIESLDIPLPPLLDQKAIAHILGSLDDKIELNRRINATLEGMAQALFKSWFVDFDPVIDNALAAGNPVPEELAERAEVRRKALADGTANREAAKQFPAAFQLTEEMGWIPEGWETVTLNQAIQINPSVKLSKGTIAPYADMKALPTDGYAIDGVIEKSYSGGAKFQNDDVLLARITPCLENGKTGIVDFLSNSTDVGFGSTEFIVLRGRGELRLPYIACIAREENFRLHCIQSMVGSSGRQRIQNACFDSFHIVRPANTTVLKKFSEIAQPMFRKASEQAKESTALTNLRDTLLPQLISGELRIFDAEKLIEEAIA